MAITLWMSFTRNDNIETMHCSSKSFRLNLFFVVDKIDCSHPLAMMLDYHFKFWCTFLSIYTGWTSLNLDILMWTKFSPCLFTQFLPFSSQLIKIGKNWLKSTLSNSQILKKDIVYKIEGMHYEQFLNKSSESVTHQDHHLAGKKLVFNR